MRKALLLTFLLLAPNEAQSQKTDPTALIGLNFTRIPKVPEPDVIPVYSEPMGSPSTEVWDKVGWGQKQLGFRIVRNVTRPTLTAFLPAAGKDTGAAVIVVPGGGFTLLQMDIEGWAVANWLADHGVTAFVLKYRVRQTSPDEVKAAAEINSEIFAPHGTNPPPPDPGQRLAIADGIAALKLVRANSKRWKINPAHVGMIGFSSGAITTLGTVLNASPADRPNFFGYIYGPMDAYGLASIYKPTDSFSVPESAPPLFAALAMDDPSFGGKGFALVDNWKKAARPVELHAYQNGGHGFGIGLPGTTSTMVMSEFFTWMRFNEVVRPSQ